MSKKSYKNANSRLSKAWSKVEAVHDSEGFLHWREVHTGKEAINRSADEQNPLSGGFVLEAPLVWSRLDYKPDAVFVPDSPLRHPR